MHSLLRPKPSFQPSKFRYFITIYHVRQSTQYFAVSLFWLYVCEILFPEETCGSLPSDTFHHSTRNTSKSKLILSFDHSTSLVGEVHTINQCTNGVLIFLLVLITNRNRILITRWYVLPMSSLCLQRSIVILTSSEQC